MQKELKKRHNIMLTDTSWDFLEYLRSTKLRKFKSRSSAIEYLIIFYQNQKKRKTK